jgi:hypothetical protein
MSMMLVTPPDAAKGGAAGEVFLVGIAGIVEMNVGIDAPGKQELASGIDIWIAGYRRSDGIDDAVANQDIRFHGRVIAGQCEKSVLYQHT